MSDGKPGFMDKVEEDHLIIRQTAEQIRKGFKNPKERTFIPMIIAIKGDPYTGKTTCADAIAKSLKCSVLSFDDILHSLSPSSPPSPEEAHRLCEVAFNIVLRHSKLQMLLQRPVVIDSPLSDPTHLQRLLQIPLFFNVSFVIVECRPAVKYAWQMRFERRDRRETDKYWFKPKEWSDVKETQSVESYAPGYLPDNVSRVIVNTTDFVELSNLGPATLDSVLCVKSHLIHFENWLPHSPIHPAFTFLKIIRSEEESSSWAAKSDECGSDGRHMLEEFELLATQEDCTLCCGACQGPIDPPVAYYACKRCNKLALHKACAELPEKLTPDYHKTLVQPSPSEEDETTRLDSPAEVELPCLSTDSVPEEHRQGFESFLQQFTIERLWDAHLKLRRLPTVIYHKGVPEQSVCFFITTPVNPREYQCAACKLPGIMDGYTCLKGTFRFNLHSKCALLPLQESNLHGGYQHDMRLVFGTEEIKEDYLCDVCGEQRNPAAWYYYCDQCAFVSHLECIYTPDDE